MRKRLILVILTLALVCMNLCVPAFAAVDTSKAPSSLISVDSVQLGGVTLGVDIPNGVGFSYGGTLIPFIPDFEANSNSYWDTYGGADYFKYFLVWARYNSDGSIYSYTFFRSNRADFFGIDYKGSLVCFYKPYYLLATYVVSSGAIRYDENYSSYFTFPESLSCIIWSNFDVINGADGSVLFSACPSFDVVPLVTNISFPSSSFTSFSTVANVRQDLATSGVSGSGSVDGDVTISYSINDPYVDFIWNQPSNSAITYNGFVVNGTFLMKYLLGLRLLGNVDDGGVYYKTDLYPSSYDVLVNGSPVGFRTDIEDPPVPPAGFLRPDSGGDSMGYYADSDTEVTFSSVAYSFDRTTVETVGIRFYFDTPLGLSDVSMHAGTFSTNNIAAYGLFSFYLYQKPTFTLTGVESVDPQPTTTTDPDPQPTTTTDPDPEPTTTTDPDPEPTTTTDPDPQPTTTIDPDPQPTTTTDPDPQPTTTTDPDPEPEPSFDASQMGILAGVITGAVDLLKLEITLFGFTFSLWQMLLFDLAASIIIWFVWRFFL